MSSVVRCSSCGGDVYHYAGCGVGEHGERIPLGGPPAERPPEPAQNTDRELWRERPGDYYADSLFVTEGGGIGMSVGGLVIVKPIREWHAALHMPAERPPELFDPRHLRPAVVVRGESWDLLTYLLKPVDQGGYDYAAPDATAVMCADYIQKLEAAYGTERELHNAWRKRAEEAELREIQAAPPAGVAERRDPDFILPLEDGNVQDLYEDWQRLQVENESLRVTIRNLENEIRHHPDGL